MKKRLEMLAVFIILVGTANLQSTAANGNSSIFRNNTEEEELPSPGNGLLLILGWINKPPYMYSLPNESIPQGMGRDVVLKYFHRCSKGLYLTVHKANNEFEMIELLRRNKVHVAAPIFEPTSVRHYSEFRFIKTQDYPGTEYITIDKGEDVVLKAILNSWPLVAFTLILTAIAGIFIWALVRFALFNILTF